MSSSRATTASPTWPSYPWIVPHERQRQNLDDFPNLKRWFRAIAERPPPYARLRYAEAYKSRPTITEESRKILFGQTARSTAR